MEIKYLKKLNETPVMVSHKTEGISIQEIEALESKYNGGKAFPKAYREYLFLAGKGHGMELDEAFGFDWLHEKSAEVLAETGLTIGRPYFVMDQLDACEQFGFFYLDEDEDDPIIYNCDPYSHIEDGEDLIKPYLQKQFSKYIEALIESAKSWDEHRGYDE